MKTRKRLSQLTFFTHILFFSLYLNAQPWIENNQIFNPTGIPSLSFSQPRFYDLDADGDLDMILGSTVQAPEYFKNTGSKTIPKFVLDKALLANVNSSDAEMGVCADLDGDGDLDFISGGYTGLHLYKNEGSSSSPIFIEAANIFQLLSVGENPIPTFADMDGDGDLDMAVGLSEDGGVKYYPNTGSIISAQFLESNSVRWFNVGLYAYPSFCDMDKDGDNDLLVGRDDYGFFYYENIGNATNLNFSNRSTLFQTLGSTTYWNSGALVDLSGDGKNDLVFGSASGKIFYYLNTGTNAEPSWSENTSLFGGTIDVGGASSPVLYDWDGDGDLDLITGTQLGSIKYFENTGTKAFPAWMENSVPLINVKHSIYSAIAVGDLNNDGKPDLIAGDFTGKLYLHLQTASGFPAVTTAMNIVVDGFASPRLIDFDHDKDLDLIVGREDGTLSFFENIGTTESAAWLERPNFFGSIDVGMDAVPSLRDFDKDGDYDLLIGNISGDLKFFYNNTFEWGEDTSITSSMFVNQNAAPAFADLDNDGDFDLVLGNYEGTFSYFENQSITGTKKEETAIPTNYFLYQNYPNPFNPSTTISYQIPAKSFVTLKVYDILGNEVAVLVNEWKETGSYIAQFTTSGKQLASGMYFYTLTAGKFTDTKKLILLK